MPFLIHPSSAVVSQKNQNVWDKREEEKRSSTHNNEIKKRREEAKLKKRKTVEKRGRIGGRQSESASDE